MSSKAMKEFTNRIAQQKKKEEERKDTMTTNGRFVTIPLNNNIALIDRGDSYISSYEIIEPVIDLFMVKDKFDVGEKIELSKVADVCFDLIYTGNNNNKEMFKLC